MLSWPKRGASVCADVCPDAVSGKRSANLAQRGGEGKYDILAPATNNKELHQIVPDPTPQLAIVSFKPV